MFKKLFGSLLGKSTPAVSAPTFGQHRKTSRRMCEIDVEGWHGKKNFFATVVDMSAGGMRLQLSSPMPVKAKGVMSVTFPEPLRNCDVLTVDCVARWTKLREIDGVQFVGLEFKDPKRMGSSWVKVKMKDLGFQSYNIRDQRHTYRLDCDVKGALQFGSAAAACTIKNISLGGMYLELPKPIRPGAAIDVKVIDHPVLPTGTISSIVRHQSHPDPSSPFGYGISFSEVSDEQVEAIKVFLAQQQLLQWEKRDPNSDYLAEASVADEPAEHENVEIPDFDAIMRDTEPEEEDEEELLEENEDASEDPK